MTLKFIPPKEQKLPRYASYGNGIMRTHTSIGAAKQSLGNRCGSYSYQRDQGWREGFILELVNGEWYVRFHVKEGTRTEDLPWYKDAWEYHGNSYCMRARQFYEPHYRPEDYKKVRVAVPETKEEYADWRVRVALEQHGITPPEDQTTE